MSGEDGKRIRGYVCDLRGQNKAFLALASGFFVPDSNQTGPAFKLILVEPNGTVNASLQEVEPGPVSVEELLDASASWVVGPVPARERVSVLVPTAAVRFEVVSVSGAVVAQGEFTTDAAGARATIDVSALATGTYMIRATNVDGTPLGLRSIVVQR